MLIQYDQQFNSFPSHLGLRKYVQYYNIVFPAKDTFNAQYTLMPSACGTLSLAFDGIDVSAELWGASLRPVVLGEEPNDYCLLLVQISPHGLYQITRQNLEYPWGQRDFRLYDPDKHIIEIAEDMNTVIRRFIH